MVENTVSLRTALITGASSGIGEAFAHLLASEGYRPVLVARRRAELERVATAISNMQGIDPVILPKDLTGPHAAAELLDEMAEHKLVPDLLINNAGFGLMGRSDTLGPEAQMQMINVNVSALTDLSLRCGKIMRQRGQGGIINVSSVAGMLPGPNMAIYYATKAYILSFTEALSFELKPFGVQVTALVPGVTKTAFHRCAGMENSRLLKYSVPMSAEAVARIGYKGFQRGKRAVATGLFNKFAAICTRFVPRSILLAVTAKLHK